MKKKTSYPSVARPNRSRVISISLKPPTGNVENGQEKTKEHETRASVVPITQYFDLSADWTMTNNSSMKSEECEKPINNQTQLHKQG